MKNDTSNEAVLTEKRTQSEDKITNLLFLSAVNRHGPLALRFLLQEKTLDKEKQGAVSVAQTLAKSHIYLTEVYYSALEQ